MTDYVNDLDKTKPTEFDPVADGAGEIRGIKEALRNTFPNANTPLTVSNESIVEAVQKVDDLVPGEDIGTTRGLFASLTYRGGSGPIEASSSNNIKDLTWVDQGNGWKFARVTFEKKLDGSDANYPGDPNNGELDVNVNVQVTAFSNGNPANNLGFAGFVYPTVTNIDLDGCEIAFTGLDQNYQFQAVWHQAFCLMVALN